MIVTATVTEITATVTVTAISTTSNAELLAFPTLLPQTNTVAPEITAAASRVAAVLLKALLANFHLAMVEVFFPPLVGLLEGSGLWAEKPEAPMEVLGTIYRAHPGLCRRHLLLFLGKNEGFPSPVVVVHQSILMGKVLLSFLWALYPEQ